MAGYLRAPPQHSDPPEDQPLGIPADPGATVINGCPPVWAEVYFTLTGRQRLPGFAEQASETAVFVQVVHMGFAHRLWLPCGRVTRRVLLPRR